MQKLACFIMFLTYCLTVQAWSASSVIDVEYGQVKGWVAGQTYRYLDVPFAQPPVNDLRWRLPQPIHSKDLEVGGVVYGKGCLQSGMVASALEESPLRFLIPSSVLESAKVVGSEDCLNLNIWAPKEANGLPVMVFVHGGAHVFGSNKGSPEAPSPMYNGQKLAEQGNVIVVTVNYRLGAFGYMAYNNKIKANLALYDVLESLKWVQRNISNFGGDPSNVTLFGESAGAAHVRAMTASPLAAGLFHKVIDQSGHSVEAPLSEQERLTEILIEKLGCAEAPDPISCLRFKDGKEIVKAVEFSGMDSEAFFGPVVDGDILPDTTLNIFKSGRQNKVPVLMGTNRDEMTTLLPMLFSGELKNEAEYKSYLLENFGDAAPEVWRQYPVSETVSPMQALQNIMGDLMFHMPAREHLAALAKTQREHVFRYVYSYESDNPFMQSMGAGHGTELGRIFANNLTDEERRMSREIINTWAAFAHAGHPNTESQNVWTPYSAERDNHVSIDFPHYIQGSKFRDTECSFWLRQGLADAFMKQ